MNNVNNVMELMPEVSSTWFKKWFDSSYYHQLYANRDEKEAAGFIDELLEKLQPSGDAQMLDLGCGAGRHSKYLASKGFSVTGLDLAFSSIRKAKETVVQGAQFYQHDMRIPFGNQRFDYVFNFFTSFGYFKDENVNHQVIQNIFNSLKPGGTLIMDYLNVIYSENNTVPNEEKEIDGIIYHISRWSDDDHFFKKISIEGIYPDRTVDFVEQVAKLELADFEYMLSHNGFRLKKVYGDYKLNEYNAETSPRLILKAERMNQRKK